MKICVVKGTQKLSSLQLRRARLVHRDWLFTVAPWVGLDGVMLTGCSDSPYEYRA